MKEFDRLTTLMERFNLKVQMVPLAQAHLVVTKSDQGAPQQVLLNTGGVGFAINDTEILLCASIDWGGDANPLFSALPPIIDIRFEDGDDFVALINLIHHELELQRCGSDSVVNRLCEILVVKILRAKIEQGDAEPGLLAGLCDPRLSRAIVVMHDQPSKDWDNQQLAHIAGLSLSRFAELFSQQIGVSPSAYLRRWRMVLARQDIRGGARISAVARRYGYQTSEGFSRAFNKQFGTNPMQQRFQSQA